MIDGRLGDYLNQLARDRPKAFQPLVNPPDANPLDASLGTGGLPAAPPAMPGVTRKEALTVYSQLIITADGAFEMPPGWPTNGDYPPGAVAPTPLPDSLKWDAGSSTLTLDTTVAYYQQKRVHIAIFLEASDPTAPLFEDWYLITMATPYDQDGLGYFQGTDAYTQTWQPLMKYASANLLNSGITSRRNTLENKGIAHE